MPGDGHSKADCFTTHFDTPLDKVLEKELQEKISKYLDFSEYHDDKIVS